MENLAELAENAADYADDVQEYPPPVPAPAAPQTTKATSAHYPPHKLRSCEKKTDLYILQPDRLNTSGENNPLKGKLTNCHVTGCERYHFFFWYYWFCLFEMNNSRDPLSKKSSFLFVFFLLFSSWRENENKQKQTKSRFPINQNFCNANASNFNWKIAITHKRK